MTHIATSRHLFALTSTLYTADNASRLRVHCTLLINLMRQSVCHSRYLTDLVRPINSVHIHLQRNNLLSRDTSAVSSAVAEKPRDALYYLECHEWRINNHQKLPNCHFTEVHTGFIHFLLNSLVLLLTLNDLEHTLKVTKSLYAFLCIGQFIIYHISHNFLQKYWTYTSIGMNQDHQHLCHVISY